MNTEEDIATAKLILNELRRLQIDGGKNTAASLFEIKDQLDQNSPRPSK